MRSGWVSLATWSTHASSLRLRVGEPPVTGAAWACMQLPPGVSRLPPWNLRQAGKSSGNRDYLKFDPAAANSCRYGGLTAGLSAAAVGLELLHHQVHLGL